MQLEVSDLFFSYDETDVLKSVSFCADRGERIAVLGPQEVRMQCRARLGKKVFWCSRRRAATRSTAAPCA